MTAPPPSAAPGPSAHPSPLDGGAAAAADRLRDPAAPQWDELLHAAIRGDGVRSVFQPIVDVHRHVVCGYEGLTRFDAVRSLSPDHWFAAAARRDLVAPLERATLRSLLSHRPDLPPNCFLTVNLEPDSLVDPGVSGVLHGADLGGVVIEITEHRPPSDPERLAVAIEGYRAAGALIAIDDAGSGYSGLQQILLLRPSILKLDRSLVEDIHVDEAKAALAEMLGTFSNRIDAWLLAEGVETRQEAQRVHQLEIPLAQGWFYGRPAAPWTGLDPESRVVVDSDRTAAGLHRLVTPLASVPSGAERAYLAEHPEFDMVVVVDDGRRPIGLLTPESAMTGTVLEVTRANVRTTPAELAARITTRLPLDTSTPTVVTDDAGRYVGIVTVARLLHDLAASAA
ncbi:EAL domain-containing protein [Dermatobacter hominis]|uniref:EAL domain-containing protein n=1 Tax=Dermatobacter hominis TaxID=2884263 RepID=UPI001D0F9AA4|nr:EAL domain-containing protein [Dermatobacter hominis]UDY34788.1 EAL domain-containing protein [Dermatobacter hominis]